ncbi:hypothetical protein [Streptomyces sp. NPDC057363]|uniref:hypothetical protein n=1 Tax=Streptomyces sp. NPDC057363 TaxID=3346107 RepID=UPI003628A15F
MGKKISGRGRVTVFRLVHMWTPRRVGIVAYASTGHFGTTAAVGYIPFPQIPDVSLLDVAARHHPAGLGDWRSPEPHVSEAYWVLCTASSSRIAMKPTSLDFLDAEWDLEVDGSVDLPKSMYSHTALRVGRFTLKDPELMRQAEGMLSEEDIPVMNAEDKPAHT